MGSKKIYERLLTDTPWWVVNFLLLNLFALMFWAVWQIGLRRRTGVDVQFGDAQAGLMCLDVVVSYLYAARKIRAT